LETILVVGGDSLLGYALAKKLRTGSRRTISTSRRETRLQADGVYRLDLIESLPQWVTGIAASCAFLCAAVTRIRESESNPEYARLVNVTRTVELAEALMSRGTFVVFPSSTAVFAADSGDARESSPVAPETTYGRLKAEAEQELLHRARRCRAPGGTAIVRITKVVSCSKEPFRDWLPALSAGRAIEPYSDLAFSPVSLAYAVEGLLAIARLRRTGVYHLSGATALTYSQFAFMIAEALGVDRSLIVPVPRHAAGGQGPHPVRPALDMRETSPLLGVFPQPSHEVAEQLVREYRGR